MSDAETYARRLAAHFSRADSEHDNCDRYVQLAKEVLVENIRREPQAELLRRTPVVVLAAGDVDASSARVPRTADANIIIFGERLYHILWLISYLAAWQITKSGRSDESSRREVGHALAQLFAAMYSKRPIDFAPEFMRSDTSDERHSVPIHLFSTCFLIAHEFAHIERGHLDYELASDKSGANQLRKNEFQADVDAANMVKAIYKWGSVDFTDSPYRNIAPLVVVAFFSCLDHMSMLSEAILLGGGPFDKDDGEFLSAWEGQSTHPHGKERFDNIIAACNYDPGSLAFRFGNSFLRFLTSCMYDFDDKDFAVIKEVSQGIRESRVPPSPSLIWHLRKSANSPLQRMKALTRYLPWH
jgi:hypothetical protein